MTWPEAERLVAALGPGGRDVLLRALTTTEEQRAELIGRLHQLSPVPDIAELSILLEEREWARQAVRSVSDFVGRGRFWRVMFDASKLDDTIY
jgi:hypothetical protein